MLGTLLGHGNDLRFQLCGAAVAIQLREQFAPEAY